MCLLSAHALLGSNADHKVLIRDVTQIEGVRDNQLVGYGLVIGLTRTGDTQQTFLPCRRWPIRCSGWGYR
jgi:flagellar P-ring protein precursor FlgI